MGFAESRAALAALEGLAGSDPAAATAALRTACQDAEGVNDVLDAWLERRLGES